LIVFIVICTDNVWKADIEQFYNTWNETRDIKTKIIDRLSKQLNVMQTTHLQQPNHILNLNERHIKHNTSVSRGSQTLNLCVVLLFLIVVLKMAKKLAETYT